MNFSAIASTAWDVTKYYTQTNRLDAFRGAGLFGKFLSDELGKSKLESMYSSALSCAYPFELFTDVIKFFETFQAVKEDDEKTLKQIKSEKESKLVSNKLFRFSLCLEAYPRTYNVVAKIFGWKAESIPGGETARILGDIGGLFVGGKMVYDSALKLRKGTDEEEKVVSEGNESDSALATAPTLVEVPLKTEKKVEQYGWLAFGTGVALAESIALAKTFKVVDAKKVPAWVSLATATVSTLGFLTATYINNK